MKKDIYSRYVDDVSKAMWREMAKNKCIMMFLDKIKKHKIKLEDKEKLIVRQAMLGP
jgi:hypothetical protein